jgi:N-acetyl-anhydromuramyl-L-alanine amidase AmpD
MNRNEPLRLILALLIAGAMLFIVAERATHEVEQLRSRRPRLILGVVVHHSATPPRVKGKLIDEAAIDGAHAHRGWGVTVKGQEYHIGYHFVVLQDGTVQPGRPIGTVGAHAGATFYNDHYLGICLVGDFDARSNPDGRNGPTRPTKRQLDATVRLVTALARRFGFGPKDIIPHRAVRETDCPGSRFPLGELRERVRQALASRG